MKYLNYLQILNFSKVGKHSYVFKTYSIEDGTNSITLKTLTVRDSYSPSSRLEERNDTEINSPCSHGTSYTFVPELMLL